MKHPARDPAIPFVQDALSTQVASLRKQLALLAGAQGAAPALQVGNLGVLQTFGPPVLINLNSGSKQAIFIGPPGRIALPSFIMIYGLSAAVTTAHWGAGTNANADNWAAVTAHAGLSATDRAKLFLPDGAFPYVAPGQIFGVKPNPVEGSALTVMMQSFGVFSA